MSRQSEKQPAKVKCFRNDTDDFAWIKHAHIFACMSIVTRLQTNACFSLIIMGLSPMWCLALALYGKVERWNSLKVLILMEQGKKKKELALP